MADASEQVSDYWGVDRNDKIHSWLQHPVLLRYLHNRVTGDPNVGTHQWFKNQFFPEPAELCLSLGCGFGAFERPAIQIGISRSFHGFDVSEGAIGSAREAAAAEGLADQISYEVRDLNALQLPPQTYDAVFAISSAHHIFRLEDYYRQVRGALKPDGLFFLDEYIGPSRFQSSPFVTEAINRVRAVLPESYRGNVFTNDGSVVESYVPARVEEFEANDPSEAIRSGALLETLKMYFDIVEFRPYGGGLSHMLFHGIMGNFDPTNGSDIAMLEILALLEETLEQAGAIESDFAAIVARPKRLV